MIREEFMQGKISVSLEQEDAGDEPDDDGDDEGSLPE